MIKSVGVDFCKRLFVIFAFTLSAISVAASTYVSKVTVNVETSSVGKGRVYVKQGNNTPPATHEEYKVDTHAAEYKKELDTEAPITTYYLFSSPEPGHYLVGWNESNSASGVIEGSNESPFERTVQTTKDNLNSTSQKTFYAIFKEQTAYKDNASAVSILVDVSGVPQMEGGNPVMGGGYVNINNSSATSTSASITNGTKYLNANPGTWFYEYNAVAQAGYKFVGWYEQDELLDQIQSTGKVDFDIPVDRQQTYYKKTYETTTLYSNSANAPQAKVMCAVFRPMPTYYHYGPAVTIAGDPADREEKGRVYADKGEAGSVNNVAAANWQTEIYDNNITSQEDNPTFTYTYYAKVEDSRYAFKGWSTTPYGEATYYDNPLQYPWTMTNENISAEKPYRTPTLYAVFESYFFKRPSVSVSTSSKGSGWVYASLESADLSYCTQEELPADENTQQVPATGSTHSYQVYYYAKHADGATFQGWSTTPDGMNIISQTKEYVATYETKSKSKDQPHVAAPLYAVFRSDIDIRQQDRMIVYIDDEGNGNINDSKVLIDFQKGNTLTATLSGADASYFTLSNRSGSKLGSSITFDATQGLIELVVAYKGNLNDAVGKVANITLSATSGEQPISRPVSITVEEAPIITFLPTDGKGVYKVSMTNGSGVNYTMNANTQENIKVAVTHESMSNIEIALTNDATDDYYFFGWQMIDGEDITYISYDQIFTYQFTKPVSVRADFVHKDIATYSIVGDATNTPYHDFALALKDAGFLYTSNGVPQTVILNDKRGATAITKTVLPKGDYTIPQGVRFLIPGKNNYNFATYEDGSYGDDYFVEGITSYNEYLRWTVEEGTTITVKGGAAICVQARISCRGGGWENGVPYDYGRIDLKENTKITFEDDAHLYAYGYVTGPRSSSIVLENGASVTEAMQIMDWRGGTITGLSLSTYNSYKIFPISQFYVQSVEAPMTLKSGAKEYVLAGINAGSGGITHMSIEFIGENAGFFHLGDGCSLTKYYDEDADRLQMTIGRESGATGTVELGSVALNVSGMGEISSASYVLPIPQNYDITIGNNAVVNVLYDVALLPGSSITVQKGGLVNMGTSSNPAKVYVYDKKYSTNNGVGFFGVSNYEFMPIVSRPDADIYGNKGIKYKRNSASIQDAKALVNGTIRMPNGNLYTTNTTSSAIDHANITSDGGGKIEFPANLGTSTTNTYQGNVVGGLIGSSVNQVAIPVSPARMLNANGEYQKPEVNTTYTYVSGKWMPNSPTTPDPIIPSTVSHVPQFTATNYTTSAFVGGTPSVGATNIVTNNTTVDWATVTWAYTLYGEHADQFKFAWTTKPNGKITFTPESEGAKTATLRITATYSYTDVYGVTAKYTYSKDIHLTGNASYLNANTLQFADLSTLFVGQGAVALFNGGNNTQPINISTSLAGIITTTGTTAAATLTPQSVGEVTITVTQANDLTNNIAGTTLTKIVKVVEAVVWNWSDLYFGTVNTNPVTIHNGATSWTLVEKEDSKNIINLQGTSPNYTASIEDQIAGKYKVTFTYSDNKGVTKDFVSTIYTNPRHLRVDVNNDTVYRAVTLSANTQVNYHSNRKAVGFSSTAQNISQWKMTFLGVPDKIYFTPEGDNTWQIEESSNGTNWTTSMPWKYLTTGQPFEMSLLPSTSYLRVSYGAGDLDSAYLKELYITELADVKADVKKIYMPIDGVNNAIKEVVLTYANTGMLSVRTTDATNFKLKFSDSNASPTDVLSIPATTEANPFGIKGIDVVCYATTEKTAELQVYNGSQLVLQIPIYAYLFPQELPIKLATDEPAGGDRYYFVTTHSHNAEWDGTDGVRTLTMNNAVSDAAPYVTFAFKGAPTFISFDYTSSAKGVWNIEESTDGKEWSTAVPAADDVMASGKLHRTVSTSSQYLRVIYESAYAEKVDLTNITIVGDASVVVHPTKLELDYDVAQQLTLTAINLTAIDIATSSSNFIVTATNDVYKQYLSLDDSTNPEQLGENKMGDILLGVKWTGNQMVEYGSIVITNPNDGDAVLATVELVGVKKNITDGNINIKTGVPSGYTLKGSFEGAEHRPVDISAAFSTEGKPHFDYVVVYGETTTNDGQSIISTPNKNAGSNAKTPYYIYKKAANGNSYELYKSVENANSSTKAWYENGDDAVTPPNGQNSVSMYITGFCPYATTGYTKDEEGVWYFRANSGQSVDVYLQDCYLYSRAKTIDGHTFADRSDGQSFVDSYSRGTGAVLVFACNDRLTTPHMNVTIHTLDNNLLKSNYGCFLQSIAGRAFQASSPVQIRLIDDTYAAASTTTLNFTDEWPASQNAKTGNGVRTNGFISLQKQVNNAPSIDMGNSRTVVNFNGGQVELQNAQIVSTNYASSLAICPRSGKFAGIFLAYGLGTDDVGGTVNFNDGTTTVQEMWVSPTYFESYLCEKDASGNYITNSKGEYLTTCLRTPTNTFVYGGSHCMMRACSDPQSQGGAPKDQPGGKLLGIYKYPKSPESGKKGGWSDNGTNGLVTPTAGNVPTNYKVESVTPNTNGTVDASDDYLNFWFDPTFEPSAQPEIDKKISFWKTCMTRIEAEYAGQGGSVGGDAVVEFAGDVQTEIVKNLLYCKIDENILTVIQADNYYAPVKNPAPAGDNYLPVHPSYVGNDQQHNITNAKTYKVENKIYYITTATADVWNAFTAPFDVAKVYVMETYPETEFVKMEKNIVAANGNLSSSDAGYINPRLAILQEQAKHNADFASFFGVTIALGQNKTFEEIYNEYLQWGILQDKKAGLYESGAYNLRGMYELVPYIPGNWKTANCYISENNGGVWNITGEDQFATLQTTWEHVDASDGILMHQGKTYSMLLPFCAGCLDGNEDGEREMWDYWSGKFLIFESTDTPQDGHEVYGTDYFDELYAHPTPAEGTAIMLGNATFAAMPTDNKEIYVYYPDLEGSTFLLNEINGSEWEPIQPSVSYMMLNIPTPSAYSYIKGVKSTGELIYANRDNTTTGVGNTPTIGGNSSLFITAISDGINIAVATPQYVRVVTSNGALIYSGMILDNIDVPISTNGIYIVAGENTAQKFMWNR